MNRKLLLGLAFLAFNGLLSAQTFQEVCSSATTNGTMVSFCAYQDTIYATGFFTTACGVPASHIAKWEDETWKPAGFSLSDPGHALRLLGDTLFIARYEESIDSNWVYFFAGQSLQKLGEGVYLTTASGFSELPNIYDVIQYEGKVVACGEFDRVGQQAIEGIMQWEGNGWAPLGSGLSGNILNSAPVRFPHQLLVHDGSLYVVGNFRYAGGMEVNGIARWDGVEWHAMGSGFNGTVYSIAEFDGELIAGGSFTASGATPLNGIARWDGAQWVSLGFGFTPVSGNDFVFVHTLEKGLSDNLYIAGGLKKITYDDGTTETCGGIVEYAGGMLNTFNGGITGNDIEAVIHPDDQTLLVGGGVFGNGYTGLLDFSTHVGHQTINTGFRVYPNPFSSILNLHGTLPPVRYALTDLSGRTVQAGQLITPTIDAAGIPPGFYVLTVWNEEQVWTSKVVKEQNP